MMGTLPQLADAIFMLRLENAAILLALFLVPLSRLVTFPLTCTRSWSIKMSALFGRWERATGWIRDFIGPPYLTVAIGWNLHHWIVQRSYELKNLYLISAIGALFLLVLNEFHRMWKRKGIKRLLDFAKKHPNVHPQEFFDYFFATHGLVRCALPQVLHQTLNPLNLDFRPPRSGRASILPLLRSLLNMMTCSRLILRAEKLSGRTFAIDTASSIAAIFSARMCQLAGAQVMIEGAEKLKDIRMPVIFLPNHTSAFDFTIMPTLLAAHQKISGADISLVPCFLLAKGHFRDNIFLYRIIGMGRAAETLGMVFVDRGKHIKAKIKEMTHQAVSKLIEGNMPIVIYPQGSRARSKMNLDGGRMDGGYYTVGTKTQLKREGGHIKKGVAFIATDAAYELAQAGADKHISLVPIAVVGAAKVLPRKGLWVKRGESVTMRVGDPITIASREVKHLTPSDESVAYRNFIISLHGRIDRALKNTLRVHAELERRFFEELRSSTDPHRLEELSIAMKQWRGDDYLVFAILDFIYTCRPKKQRGLLGQLVHLILSDAPREELVAFKENVADLLPK